MGFLGVELSDFLNDIDVSNTIDGKPVYYWINQNNKRIPSDAGFVAVVNSTNITVKDLTLSNNGQGVLLAFTMDSLVENVSASHNSIGIQIHKGRNNTIISNSLSNNRNGIELSYSIANHIAENIIENSEDKGIALGADAVRPCDNNHITGNTIIKNSYGVFFYSYCCNNVMDGNNITNNSEGIRLSGSADNNVLTRNTITTNDYGIILEYSDGNNIYHNNFINNHRQVGISGKSLDNAWDDGYPSGGNYWSDYIGVDEFSGPYQNETGSDGIGDTPYGIMGWKFDIVAEDRYPLTNPLPWTPTPPFVENVGVETGDWIKYDYTITGAPPETPLPQWMKAEFMNVEETTAAVRVTMHMSDGTEQNQTMTVDLIAGNGTIGTFSGFVILANSSSGDFAYISGLGNVIIAGETTRTYAGASRTVVYTSFSQYGVELTYYWDKQTGVMVEASAISGNMTGTAKATETNMWQAQPLLVGDLDNDGKVDIQDLAVAANAFGSYTTHPRWNPIADVNKDNIVNIIDIVTIAKNFGKTM